MKLWRYGQEIESLGKRYQLIGSLGSGGMADVCLATDVQEKREVAIKVIKSDKLDQTTLNRFLQEITQTQKLKHRHILTIYSGLNLELLDVSRGSIVPYIVMEYAQGGDLHSRLTRSQPYPFEEMLRVFSQLCRAVQYAHKQGVIHRDLKPHNILIRRLPDRSEQIALGDFGMAVEVDATHHTFADGGTPLYMAPEQFSGKSEAASDIFALGVILYQLTTGQFPFRHSSLYHYATSEDAPIAPSQLNPKLPKALDEVILTALAKLPSQRFASAALFWKSVHAAVTLSPVPPLLPHHTASIQPSSPTRLEETPITKELSHPSVQTPRTAPTKMLETNAPGRKSSTSVRKRDLQTVLPIVSHRKIGTVGVGSVPQPKANANSGGRIGPRRAKRGVLLIALAIFLVFTTVVFGGIALEAPNLLGLLRSTIPNLASTTTVTIIPDTKTESNNYLTHGVQSNPDAANQEVLARAITTSSTSQSQTVSATGAKQAATVASGVLTFVNGTFSEFTVAAGTAIQTTSGISVITNAPANVPASVPGGNEGATTVGAHASTGGAIGNIGALTLNKTCCSATNAIFVKNLAAFTGGQDAQNYTFVQQSDIQGATDALQPSLLGQAEDALKTQIHSNEQIAGSTTCSPLVTSDHSAGDRATSVTVTVKVTCQAEVYDQKGTLALVTDLLKTKATNDYGANYALVGNVIAQARVQSVNKGIVNLLVSAKGIWAYQFTDARQLELKKLIAGKSAPDALTILKSQTGVADASLDPNSGTLPTNTDDIKFVIQPVTGLSGGGTPGASDATPTVTGPGITPTTQS